MIARALFGVCACRRVEDKVFLGVPAAVVVLRHTAYRVLQRFVPRLTTYSFAFQTARILLVHVVFLKGMVTIATIELNVKMGVVSVLDLQTKNWVRDHIFGGEIFWDTRTALTEGLVE